MSSFLGVFRGARECEGVRGPVVQGSRVQGVRA